MLFDYFYLFPFTGEVDRNIYIYNMFKSIFITLSTFLILSSNNIVLLNEETLILICFTLFIWLSWNSLGIATYEYFYNYSQLIESSIKNPLVLILNNVKNFTLLKTKSKILIVVFVNLKTHFLNLISLIFYILPCFYDSKRQSYYFKYFFLAKQLEQQSTKLLTILILKKLVKLAILKQFYLKTFDLAQFTCLYKISLQESLTKIIQSK